MTPFPLDVEPRATALPMGLFVLDAQEEEGTVRVCVTSWLFRAQPSHLGRPRVGQLAHQQETLQCRETLCVKNTVKSCFFVFLLFSFIMPIKVPKNFELGSGKGSREPVRLVNEPHWAGPVPFQQRHSYCAIVSLTAASQCCVLPCRDHVCSLYVVKDNQPPTLSTSLSAKQ